MAEIDIIDLTEATPNQIAKWVQKFKLPGRLVDLFESGKIKEAYFFIDSKPAEKARTTELRDLKFTPLESQRSTTTFMKTKANSSTKRCRRPRPKGRSRRNLKKMASKLPGVALYQAA